MFFMKKAYFLTLLMTLIFCLSSAFSQPYGASKHSLDSSQDQACTAFRINASDGTIILGRSMEFVSNFGNNITLVPRGFQYTGTAPDGKPGFSWKTKYGILGASCYDQPQFTDGMNEAGLAVSSLWFPGFAEYQEVGPENASRSMAPWELTTWALGSFATVEEFRNAIGKVLVWNAISLAVGTTTPQHYIFYDAKGGCLVLEYVNGQANIYDNSLGVMTNSPPFPWHVTNLKNYVELRAQNVLPVNISGIEIPGTSQGTGMLGLPGDYTSPSRFVRCVALTQTAYPPKDAAEGVNMAFHILNAFDITKGVVRTEDNGKEVSDYTQWVTVKDITNKVLYYRTYDNLDLRKVDLKMLNFGGNKTESVSLLEGREEIQDLSDRFN